MSEGYLIFVSNGLDLAHMIASTFVQIPSNNINIVIALFSHVHRCSFEICCFLSSAMDRASSANRTRLTEPEEILTSQMVQLHGIRQR